MSALVIGLLILAVVGLGYLAVEAHRKDMAALNAKWQAKYDEDLGEAQDALADAEQAARDAETMMLLAVEEIDRLTLGQSLAPVVPIGGRG